MGLVGFKLKTGLAKQVVSSNRRYAWENGLAEQPEQRPRRHLTNAQVADLVSLYEEGASSRDVAAQLGVSRNAVLQLLRSTGASVRLQRHVLSEHEADVAVERYTAGSSLAEVAVELHVSPGTVSRALRARGVQLRPRGRRRLG